MMTHGFSTLYVSCPKNKTPSSIISHMINLKISPRYSPAIIFSNACSPGLFEVWSISMSYEVRGKFSWVVESNAPLPSRAR